MLECPLIILGANPLNRGMLNREKFKCNEIIMIDWRDNPPISGDVTLKFDIKDSKSILNWLQQNQVKNIRGVLTTNDVGVPTQRIIHEYFGFLTPSEQVVNDVMIKSKCTDIWRKSGLLTRFSKTFDQIPTLDQLPATDLIVKPNFADGNRGVKIIYKDSQDDFVEAFNNASKESWDHKVIIEEYIHGTEFCIELLGDSYGNVEVWGICKKYHTRYNLNNPISMKNHYNPADVSDNVLQKISDIAIKLYKAVGLKTSFADMEVILDDQGNIHPLELGARSSGFIMSDLVDAINPSRVFVNEYLDVIRGKKIGNGYIADKNLSSMYFFYDLGDCVIKTESNLMEFLPATVKSLYHDRSELKVGNHLHTPLKDSERPGFEILSGARNVLTIENVIKAEEQLKQKISNN